VQGHKRQLQQNAFCPEGCITDMCTQDSTIGGLRCQKCESNLMVNSTDGSCCESRQSGLPSSLLQLAS
jgi:hypothetical protein